MPAPIRPKRVTHGMQTTYVGTDGIKREIYFLRLEDGAVCFKFRTWWDGEDKEPMESDLSLGIEAFNRVSDMLAQFHFDREHYALPRDPADSQEEP